MYGASFEPEAEKKASVTALKITRNLSGLKGGALAAAAARRLRGPAMRAVPATAARPRQHAHGEDHQEVPPRLHALVHGREEAREVLVHEEEGRETRVAQAHQDEPRRGDQRGTAPARGPDAAAARCARPSPAASTPAATAPASTPTTMPLDSTARAAAAQAMSIQRRSCAEAGAAQLREREGQHRRRPGRTSAPGRARSRARPGRSTGLTASAATASSAAAVPVQAAYPGITAAAGRRRPGRRPTGAR